MMRSHISTASSILCVTIRIDLIGMRPSTHRSRRSVRSVSAVSTSSAENGSSISRIFGMHDQRAGEADALAHAARKLLRKGRFEAVEADEVDRLQGARCALPPSATLRARRPSSTFASTESQGNSAKLWNTMATPSTGPSTGSPR